MNSTPFAHPSDFWPVRRWATYPASRHTSERRAKAFMSEMERDAWVAERPYERQAVGKRHPIVTYTRLIWHIRAAQDAHVAKVRARTQLSPAPRDNR
jgi:hypothetical protein